MNGFQEKCVILTQHDAKLVSVSFIRITATSEAPLKYMSLRIIQLIYS